MLLQLQTRTATGSDKRRREQTLSRRGDAAEGARGHGKTMDTVSIISGITYALCPSTATVHSSTLVRGCHYADPFSASYTSTSPYAPTASPTRCATCITTTVHHYVDAFSWFLPVLLHGHLVLRRRHAIRLLLHYHVPALSRIFDTAHHPSIHPSILLLTSPRRFSNLCSVLTIYLIFHWTL